MQNATFDCLGETLIEWITLTANGSQPMRRHLIGLLQHQLFHPGKNK